MPSRQSEVILLGNNIVYVLRWKASYCCLVMSSECDLGDEAALNHTASQECDRVCMHPKCLGFNSQKRSLSTVKTYA